MKKTVLVFVLCFFSLCLFASSSGVPILEKTKSDIAKPNVRDAKSTLMAQEKSNASPKSDKTIAKKLSELLPSQNISDILQNVDENGHSKVSHMLYNEKISTKLLPNSPLAKKIVSLWQNKECVFMIENLYLYKKPKNAESTNDSKLISDILHSVSTLEGIEYYSTSRGKMRTLYEKSYAVTPITSGKKTSYQKIPDNLNAKKQLVLQKDLTFGEFIYKYSYFADNEGIGFVCENIEKLKYGFFSLVAPYNMNVALVILDLEDYLLAYTNTRANFAKLPGIDNKLQNSFSTRADAIYNWFIKAYEKEKNE